ncbi:hypothetical protein PLICRDRAFT_34452 [Plicaturopsis crispa FD-325 SS-3]|nr:hypothetical protein PLICRDRAFT_34452 [Plicaturopsis crispa FD-325 SS-3]
MSPFSRAPDIPSLQCPCHIHDTCKYRGCSVHAAIDLTIGSCFGTERRQDLADSLSRFPAVNFLQCTIDRASSQVLLPVLSSTTPFLLFLQLEDISLSSYPPAKILSIMSATKRKILMLHGYAQNGSIFSKRIGSVRKAIGKNVELVFVDAPHILYPADLAATFGESADLSAVGAADATVDDPTLTPRGWWKVGTGVGVEKEESGMVESLLMLRDVLKGDHYDGILGFSQGAGMAAVLAALLERPQLLPSFLVDGQPPHPPVKFLVSVSGFKAPGPLAAKIFEPKYNTPTLHIIGKMDVIVVAERSRTLTEISAVGRVEEHDGGHFVPSKASWRNFLRDFMSADDPFSVQLAPAPASAPASGTATPINKAS